MNRNSIISALFALVSLQPISASAATNEDKVLLGRMLFFDNNLSLTRNQSCSSCHNPAAGFVDSRDNGVGAAASLGDDGKSLGDRSTPTASYAALAPEFHFDAEKQRYIGGQFWDGRASNLADQAGGPPINPIEMAMPDKASVVSRLLENKHYQAKFRDIYGEDIFSDTEKAYAAMTDSIASFEQTDFFSPFDSKYDRYLKGEYELSMLEELGMALFFSNNNTNCATCHVLKGEDQPGETFTNYEFHNIGTPINSALRAKNGSKPGFIDRGLLDNPDIDDVQHSGKFKVPTLRNVAVTAPYMHNGVFRELHTVIEFYDQYNNDQRKLNPETGLAWRKGEIQDTINLQDLKAKKLTDRKVDALVAFLRLLTDRRYEPLLN